MAVEFTKSDVERTAALARLVLTEEEKTLYAAQVGRILRYAEQVQEIDTSGVKGTARVLDRQMSERPDEVGPSLDPAQALANAPDPALDVGFFKVPRVLGG
jgi:aspartyl-tRNA(Asn)/glutamyl-tRNA(Gln) amidotransferase subunit C